MEICIDFDGTCVTHEFPRVGKDIGAVPVLKKIINAGHNLILFSMRSDIKKNTEDEYTANKQTGDFLTEAVNWFKRNDIKLYGINENPTQTSWTNSPKAYGQLYIDDAALGCPLIYNPKISDRPFVDWIEIEKILKKNKIIH